MVKDIAAQLADDADHHPGKPFEISFRGRCQIRSHNRSQIRSQMDYGDHNEDSPAHLAMNIVEETF